MVGQEAIRIARRLSIAGRNCATATALALPLFATLPAMAAAQNNTPTSPPSTAPAPNARQACPSTPILAEATSLRTRRVPLVLPQDWLPFVSASRDWIAVRTQMDSVHCLETAWFDDADNFERFDDRFIGFAWAGNEAWGYVLIDTVGAGSSMDVGAKPVFSPGGYRFAALQVSEAGWGGFEGFAIWRTYPGGITPEHVDTQPPRMVDWRLDRWEGNDCLHVSAIPYDRIEDWENLTQYSRDSYVSGSATGWKLTAGNACPTY